MTTVEHEERGGESTSLLDDLLLDLRPGLAIPVIVLVITIAWIAGVAH